MNWLLLVIAGLFEVGFATCLGMAREASGNTRTAWLAGFLVCLTLSMLLLYRAVQGLPVGTAYAVWTGIGAVGTAAFGMLVLGEPATALKIAGVGTIAAGIAMLKLAG